MPRIFPSTESTPPSPKLTSREKDILQLIADGHRLEEIGLTLELPEPEIEQLMKTVEEKLGASNRLHAVTIAVLHGHIAIGPEQPR